MLRALLRRLVLAVLMPMAFAGIALAADSTPAPASLQAKQEAAWAAAAKVAVGGPTQIKLLDQATLTINKGEYFIPAAEANQIMDALGNSVGPDRFGLIVSGDAKAQWMVDVVWTKEGYVRDGDAKDWQADALLDSLREGTENGNAKRLEKGIPALDVVGWIQPPVYDSKTYRLVWSLALRDRGAAPDVPQVINYNTYALGREGYFSLDLLTDSRTVEADKPVVRELLDSLVYVPGKKYEEFDASTDKVAAYGIAALVGAVAVKKLGLFALAAAFVLKIWKVAMVLLFAGFAGIRRFLARRNTDGAE